MEHRDAAVAVAFEDRAPHLHRCAAVDLQPATGLFSRFSGVVVFIACDRGDRYLSSDLFRQ